MSALLSAHQAAARCGVSERTVRRWIAAGLLDADKQGGAFRVSLEAVRTLAAARLGRDADNGQPADGAAAPPDEGPDSAAPGPDMPRQPEPGAGVPEAVADLDRAVDALERLITTQRETIVLLTSQLEARTREVSELHILLQTAQARSLPPQGHEAPPAPEVAYPSTAPPRRVHRRLRPWQQWLRRVVLGE